MVAAKFFPIDATDGSGRQVPLCETDYFRRLNLLCAKCGQALRGSYITALGASNPSSSNPHEMADQPLRPQT